MYTPSQVAKQARVTPQTIRNYSRDFAQFLSPQASGAYGPRLYTEEDVRTLCAIADLRKAGVPATDIPDRLRRHDVPPIIDVPPQTPINPDFNPSTPPQNAYMLQALPTISSRFDAIERKMQDYMVELRVDLQKRNNFDKVWYIGMGVWIGMITMGAIFFSVWLAVNGAPW